MGYPTQPSRFAVQFLDMADAFAENPAQKFSKQFKNRRGADKMRLQFYAFRTAARKNGDLMKDYPALDTIEAIISEDNTITFQCKDYSEIAEALNDMLRANGIAPSTDPLPSKKSS